jgi:RNA polymerase sigma factor (sigma-70 family)
VNTLVGHWTGTLWPVVSQPWIWLTTCLFAVLVGASAFLAEWQRRATLVALVRDAPAGTVVVQERGRGGPAMLVHVGDGPESEGTSVTRRRIREDVSEQVDVLWGQEAGWLHRYAMLLTGGDRAAVEDLGQRTFLDAAVQWESLADLDAVSRGKWLRRVCQNKWIDTIRRDATRERLHPEVDLLYSREAPDPALAAIVRDDLERCWQVICGFPPRRRQIALLYFMEQESVLRIAELLDIQPSGVRKHVAKAKEALRAAVSDAVCDPSLDTSASREGEGEQS